MTELPGLPVFGAEPVFAADDTRYAVLARRARDRRRGRLAASTAAVVALTAVTVTRPAADDRAGLRPTTGGPAATSTAPGEPDRDGGTGPAATGGPRDRAAAPRGPAGPASRMAAPPSHPGEPGAPSGREPEPHRDCVDSAGNFVACDGGSTARPVPEWRETSEYVPDDRPAEECAATWLEGWCFRYLGPRSTDAGAKTTFAAELCRLPNGRGAARIDLTKEDELAVVVLGTPDADGNVEHTAASFHDSPDTPHSRPIEAGRCLRWTLTWNGITDGGEVFPPGTYSLQVLALGTTPRDPLPGEANQEADSGHGERIDGFTIR